MADWMSDWMADCMTDWMADYMTDWVTDCMTDLMADTGWLTGWLGCCFIFFLFGVSRWDIFWLVVHRISLICWHMRDVVESTW